MDAGGKPPFTQSIQGWIYAWRIAGDTIGSVYEHRPVKSEDFRHFRHSSTFTDDTVMSLAAAKSILGSGNCALEMNNLGRLIPDAGYRSSFGRWIFEDELLPDQRWGNGAALRVDPIGFAFDSEGEVLREAQASALVMLFARQAASKGQIQEGISDRFGYNLDRSGVIR